MCEIIPFPKAPPLVLLASRPSPVYVPSGSAPLFEPRQCAVRILPWILAGLTAMAVSFGAPVLLGRLL